MDKFLDFCKKNKGLVVGALIGALVGLLFILVGFWKTLLLALFIVLGAVIGKNKNIRNSIIDFLDKILPFK